MFREAQATRYISIHCIGEAILTPLSLYTRPISFSLLSRPVTFAICDIHVLELEQANIKASSHRVANN